MPIELPVTARRARKYFVLLLLGIALGAGRVACASDLVQLVWDASATEGVTSYNVRIGTHSGVYSGTISFDVGEVTWDSSSCQAYIPGLVGGQTYYFEVSAVDGDGNESVPSNEASYAVPVPTPLDLQAQTSTMTDLAADLNWTPSGEYDVNAYAVFYGTRANALTNSATFYFATSGTVTGLVAGATYYFSVAPMDTYGVESVVSSAVSCSVAAPTPMVMQAHPSASAGLAVDVSWNPSPLSGVYGYQVNYHARGADYTESKVFYDVTGTVTGLLPGTNYDFTVSPVDSFGVEDIVSPQVSCVVTSPPPLKLQAQASASVPRAVTLTWDGSPLSAVTGYTIYYGTDRNNLTESTFSYYTSEDITWLTGGTNYYFTVVADDFYGDQYGFSNVASYAVPRPAPMSLTFRTDTDDNGQPYQMHIYTTNAVSGQWEVDYSYDLQNWSYWTSGYGSGNGDGHDLETDAWLDPSQPPMFFRAINF
jgi:hypothetical protein